MGWSSKERDKKSRLEQETEERLSTKEALRVVMESEKFGRVHEVLRCLQIQGLVAERQEWWAVVVLPLRSYKRMGRCCRRWQIGSAFEVLDFSVVLEDMKDHIVRCTVVLLQCGDCSGRISKVFFCHLWKTILVVQRPVK